MPTYHTSQGLVIDRGIARPTSDLLSVADAALVGEQENCLEGVVPPQSSVPGEPRVHSGELQTPLDASQQSQHWFRTDTKSELHG